LVEALKMLLH